MADFLFLFRGDDPREAGFSPEEMQQYFQKWRDWSTSMVERNVFLGGHPLERDTGTVLRADGVVSDGPYAESKEIIAGYIAVSVDAFDEAVEIARGCPIFEIGGTVEVRTLMPSCRQDA